MDILPPRRPGQLGAIPAGTGAAGPSGSFSIAASAKAKAGAAPMQRVAPSKPGSIATLPPQSVSEQVTLKQAANAQAARAAVPSPQADVFAPKGTVGVQSYVPPKGTPAITKPAALPNSSATVKLLANQIPQTKEQAIQKVLAADAGIAVPIKGGPPTVSPKPPESLADYKRQKDLSRQKELSRQKGGVQNVDATTSPGVDVKRLPPPPTPILTPRTMKTAAAASGAVVGAKIAEQKAAVAEMNAKSVVDTFQKLDAAAREAFSEARDAVADAKAASVAAKEAKQEASAKGKSQTVSEVDKADSEAEMRAAEEAAELLAMEAYKKEQKLKAAHAAREEALQAAEAAAKAAEIARQEAEQRAAVAKDKVDVAIETQAAVDEKFGPLLTEVKASVGENTSADSGNAGAQIIPFPSGGGSGGSTTPREDGNVVVLPAKPPAPTGEVAAPASSTRWGLILLGVGAVAAVAYAVAKESSNLNGVPLVAELDDEDEE